MEIQSVMAARIVADLRVLKQEADARLIALGGKSLEDTIRETLLGMNIWPVVGKCEKCDKAFVYYPGWAPQRCNECPTP